MLHAKLGRWFQPGGHADGDGDLPGVAWREATEETGIAGLRVVVPAVDLDIHEVGPPHGPHLHLDVRYLVVAPPGAVPVGNHESLDLRWATYDELPSFGVDDGLLRLARGHHRAAVAARLTGRAGVPPVGPAPGRRGQASVGVTQDGMRLALANSSIQPVIWRPSPSFSDTSRRASGSARSASA